MRGIIGLVLCTAVVYGCIAGITKLEEYRCGHKWRDSGYAVRFNFGCQVQFLGKWVPEENLRLTP